jgi:hypothetical protein
MKIKYINGGGLDTIDTNKLNDAEAIAIEKLNDTLEACMKYDIPMFGMCLRKDGPTFLVQHLKPAQLETFNKMTTSKIELSDSDKKQWAEYIVRVNRFLIIMKNWIEELTHGDFTIARKEKNE